MQCNELDKFMSSRIKHHYVGTFQVFYVLQWSWLYRPVKIEKECHQKSVKIPLTDHVTNEELLGSVDEKEPYWVESSLANWDAILE